MEAGEALALWGQTELRKEMEIMSLAIETIAADRSPSKQKEDAVIDQWRLDGRYLRR